MIEQLASFVGQFDPWWLVAAGLALILLDWALLQTEAFMIIGFSLFVLAALNALGASPIVQLWAYPVALLATFFLQRKFFSMISSKSSPYGDIDKHVGASGAIILLNHSDNAGQHFYQYKSGISVETAPKISETQTLKVQLDNAQVFPAKAVKGESFTSGDRVKVVGVSNGALIVKLET